jgi:hypothetical protein
MTGSAHYASFCSICNSPVSLETCNTDERGSPVHEQCYVRKTIARLRTGTAVDFSVNMLRFHLKSA